MHNNDAGCGELQRGVGQNLATMSFRTTFYCAQTQIYVFFNILHHILVLSLCFQRKVTVII